MIYQALYRKYRPKTFDEVSGQEIIVKTLKNMIMNNKITHAYLFIGPRGTGKTSVAKIFAKTINCENTKNGVSCENCEICNLSNDNENIDIIEMDAASNNGVDEIREIKNHVTLLPSFSKYKIYIIDEVHMLSQGAFNALLKTLEEPPKHVIFILATTEPQKVPLTIISRCQCYEFKPIPKKMMKERLDSICKNENINIENSALDLIIRSSNGGMRDAIGLLDQLNSYSDGNIKEEDVLLLNGRISNDDIEQLFQYIIDSNVEKYFEFSEKIENEGKNFITICEDIINKLKEDIILFNSNVEKNSLIHKINNEKIVEIVFTINEYLNQMKNANDKKIYFDLLLIKLNELLKNNKNMEQEISNKKVQNLEQPIDKNELLNENTQHDSKKYEIYHDLMKIRLNNILKDADKTSFVEYNNYIKNKLNESFDLEDLKIKNLLLDCTIKAGSKNGIIITTSNNNILNELFDNLSLVEKKLQDRFSKTIKICFYEENEWTKVSEIYRTKKRNKENIELLDESEILSKILMQNKKNMNEFEDLLEIGEI